MAIFSGTAPRPLFRTDASREVARIRVNALNSVPMEYEPPRKVRFFRFPRIVRVIRHRLYLYMEEPTSSKKALGLNIFLSICNILSVLAYCLESEPFNVGDGVSSTVWFSFEVCLMVIFTLELICRAPAHTTLKHFVFRRPSVFIDFIACVPFDIYLFFGVHWWILDTRWIRPLRLLRLVALGNNILDLKLILTGLRRSIWMIMLVWCLAFLFDFFFASLLFLAERGPWDSKKQCYLDQYGTNCAQFSSIPMSLYFCLEVTSSLGYGDMVPETGVGQMITMLLMVFSVCIIALTVTVFSVKFSDVYQGVKRDILLESLREATDLHMRAAKFDSVNKSDSKVNDASCRLVTCIEVLRAVSTDLSETMKRVRADLVLLSSLSTQGSIEHNPIIGKLENSFPAVVERVIAELASAAFNDIDTLTWFTLSTTEDLFVNSVCKHESIS